MKKVILAISIFIYLSLTAFSQNSGKFAFLTDTHIASQAQSVLDLEACIEDINSDSTIDFAIFGGDITEFGSDAEIKLAKSIIDKLNKPYYIVAGNHDSKWSESGCNTFAKVFGYEHFCFDAFGITFIGTNSGPNMRMAPALVPRESIVWLDSLISATPSQKPVIFVNHFPMDSSVLNYFEVLDILKESNVQMLIGGHWHNNTILDFEGIPGVLCRSTMAHGQKGAGYTVFTVDGGRISATQKIAGGESLDTWFTLPFSRMVPFKARNEMVGKRPDYSCNTAFPQVKELWTIHEKSDIGAGAAYSEDYVVYTTVTGFVKCVSIDDGVERWCVETGGKIFSTPAIYKNYVVVGSTDNIIYCFNLKDGSVIWKHHCDKSVLASPSIYKNVVYIGASDGKFRALNIKNGILLWIYQDVKGFVEAKAYVDDFQVVVGDWANALYSFNTKTGKLQWKWNTSGSRMYSPAAVWPVKSHNRIYIVTPKRNTYAVEASSGNTIWEHRGGRESIGISPSGDKIFVKTMKDTIFCFSDDLNLKAHVNWAADAKIGYDIAPTPISCELPDKKNPDHYLIFIPTDKGDIVAMKSENGEVAWRHKLSYALINYILPLEGNRLLVTTMDGKVSILTY